MDLCGGIWRVRGFKSMWKISLGRSLKRGSGRSSFLHNTMRPLPMSSMNSSRVIWWWISSRVNSLGWRSMHVIEIMKHSSPNILLGVSRTPLLGMFSFISYALLHFSWKRKGLLRAMWLEGTVVNQACRVRVLNLLGKVWHPLRLSSQERGRTN